MKYFRKTGCIFLGMLMTAFLLSGCSLSKADMEEGKVVTIEKGILKVGMNLHEEPMSYVGKNARPAGFEADLAGKIAEKLGLKLEIIDTTEQNLLKSLDAKIYDCAISTIGVCDWNLEAYTATKPYADISSVMSSLSKDVKYTQIAVFGKKGSVLIPAIEKQALEPLKQDGGLSEVSQNYFGTDIIMK